MKKAEYMAIRADSGIPAAGYAPEIRRARIRRLKPPAFLLEFCVYSPFILLISADICFNGTES